jgi:hypothetical protein
LAIVDVPKHYMCTLVVIAGSTKILPASFFLWLSLAQFIFSSTEIDDAETHFGAMLCMFWASDELGVHYKLKMCIARPKEYSQQQDVSGCTGHNLDMDKKKHTILLYCLQ